MLKEEFLRRALLTHTEEYDYSLVPNDISTKEKVKIKCCRCNKIFEQKVERHIRGDGCDKCNHLKPFEQFVEEARLIHGNTYIYNKNDYYNRDLFKGKVRIFCTKCNTFFIQNPRNHLIGKGCSNCSKSKHLDLEEFFNKIKNIFGNKYDYSQAVYIDSKHKIKLYCKKCDIWFEKDTHHLLRGHGCPYCEKGQPNTYKIFVENARKIHGNKYDYDKKTFDLHNPKVKIYCKKCKKWFWQSKMGHISGKGCIECAGVNKKDTKTFIQEARAIHGDGYDYSETEYKGAWHKVKIMCNHCHKMFEMRARLHLSGQGCPHCQSSKGEKQIKKFLLEQNIRFVWQKGFERCKVKRILKFDFYLPDHNLCIEYQGIQHYFPIKMFGGEKNFKLRQEYDQIKRNFCIQENIKLLEIRYDENIEEKLKETLKRFL